MIIVFDKPNQLCNRIWSQAPIIAKALSNGTKVKIPFFGEYASLFDNLNKFNHIRFSHIQNSYYVKGLRLSYKLLRAFPKKLLEKSKISFQTNSENLDWKNDKHLFFASSWNNKNPCEDLLKHHDQLIKIYAPKTEFKKRVDDFFFKMRNAEIIIVGVHIRRGDYRKYKNGIFHFENDVYLDYMKQFKNLDELMNKNVIYFLSSNETINKNDFSPLNVTKLENSNPIEDVYALSLCDYIIGPQSTFSQWASFYGQKPLQFIDKSKKLSFSNFSPIVSQNRFANGNHLKNQYVISN